MSDRNDRSQPEAGGLVARLADVVGRRPGTVFAVATDDGRVESVADSTGHRFDLRRARTVLDLVAERDRPLFSSLLGSLPQRPVETANMRLTLCDARQRPHPSRTIVWYDTHTERLLLLACLDEDAPGGRARR